MKRPQARQAAYKGWKAQVKANPTQEAGIRLARGDLVGLSG